jgi:hypothetical protein
MARCVLAGDSQSGRSSDHYQVLVHVDASALEGHGGESSLPLETVRRLCCDGDVTPVLMDEQGVPLSIGRKQRTTPKSIRQALLARDKRCTFPGCTHERWLDTHHVVHWAEGGETSLSNLLLVCTHHHRLLHEGGFALAPAGNGRLRYLRPDGRPVEVHRFTSAGPQVKGVTETKVAEVRDSAPNSTNLESMGRDYAGILATTAFVTVIARGLVMSGGIESIMMTAIGAMFLFALLGWLIGNAAARIVDESVRQRINTELEAMEQSGNLAASNKSKSVKPAA